MDSLLRSYPLGFRAIRVGTWSKSAGAWLLSEPDRIRDGWNRR
ncbi:hypothetical protein [Haladaptatus sp. W1]|nr:hypothetical protein [Haladaptatus sp. W1]